MFAFSMIRARFIDVGRIDKSPHMLESGENSLELEEPADASQVRPIAYLRMLGELVEKKVWLLMSLSISVLYFIVTGIQFWFTNYMETVLHQPPHLVYIIFSSVSITAPVLGCITGNLSDHTTAPQEVRSQTVSEATSQSMLCPFVSVSALQPAVSAFPSRSSIHSGCSES
jgi:sugar phosphate permease